MVPLVILIYDARTHIHHIYYLATLHHIPVRCDVIYFKIFDLMNIKYILCQCSASSNVINTAVSFVFISRDIVVLRHR